ncbi:MAG: T9SS type A sorting domain-containing protein [Saprospiraceae bacterium]|nr:T9SS type A sorting domain-containing protein [Saprospiraceae bacterium]
MKLLIIHFLVIFFTLNMNAQCFMDQHSTTWYDGWISCNKKQSPNPDRGVSHWILYNLGHRYALGETYWWNNNEADRLSNGVKKMAIDVSLDGITWISLPDFDMPEASGKPIYEGFIGPSLDNIEARYILLTALQNHGGSCYGFGEMKMNVTLSTNTVENTNKPFCLNIKAFPNPFFYHTEIDVTSNCNEEIVFIIEDAFGRQLEKKTISQNDKNTFTFNATLLPAGIYFISAFNKNQQIRKKLIKVN